MKKTILFLTMCLFIVYLSACGRSNSATSTTQPIPSYEISPDETDVPIATETEAPTSSPTPTKPAEDKRDEPEVIRQEISNMLRDTEALIDEGLFDDARTVLRDLRSRDLTETELKKVDELHAKLQIISE